MYDRANYLLCVLVFALIVAFIRIKLVIERKLGPLLCLLNYLISVRQQLQFFVPKRGLTQLQLF